MGRPAIFLDRDGVINANRSDYVKSWAEFQFLPGALAALRRLATRGVLTVVVSNQSAIGRGIISQADVEQIHQRMQETVQKAGGMIHHIFYCPHAPAADCACRKPRPGLLWQAQAQYQIALSRSVLIGDALSDIEAAQAAGVSPILVKSGRGCAQLAQLSPPQQAKLTIANNLADAVAQILATKCWIQAWTEEGDQGVRTA